MRDKTCTPVVDLPKKHPRKTPAPSMEALALIEEIEAMMRNLPKVPSATDAHRTFVITPTFAIWVEKQKFEFPMLETIAIQNVDRCIKNSVCEVLMFLEDGFPPRLALGFLPDELMQLLEIYRLTGAYGGTE